jgi:hypothetical protein
VVQYRPLPAWQWPAVSASVVGGAVVAIAVTGLVRRAVSRAPDPVDR